MFGGEKVKKPQTAPQEVKKDLRDAPPKRKRLAWTIHEAP